MTIIRKCVPPRESFSCESNSFLYEKLCTKTRFETEAQGYSDNGPLNKGLH